MNCRIKLLAWIAAAAMSFASSTHASGASTRADESAGAQLFRDKGCAYCHGASLEGTKKAPAIAGLRKDKAWPPAKITKQILDGGQKMPPFRESLTDDEIRQLVAYLRAKKKPVLPLAAASPPPAN